MKNKKILISILGVLVTVFIVFATLLFIGVFDVEQSQKIKTDNEPNYKIIEVENIQQERDIWLQNKKINSDYIGELIFESGMIDKSFVQAKSTYDSSGNLYHFYTENGKLIKDAEGYTGNDVYIWTNWKDMSYDYNIEGGSVFMDYRNDLDDQNIIIYGHHFSLNGGNDPERIKAFTPLEKLLDENNFKDNNVLRIILDNETRTYELVYVYKYDVNDENCTNNMQYYRTNYNYDDFENKVDEDYYSNYINNLEKYKLYDTGKHLTVDDRTLTLQTCISARDGEMFEICVFKQVDIEYY